MYFCFHNFFLLILPPLFYLYFFISFSGLFSSLFPQLIVLILSVSGTKINTYIITNLHISNKVNLSFKKKKKNSHVMYYYNFFVRGVFFLFFYLYNIVYIKIQVVHIWCFLFMSFFYEHFFPIFQLGLFQKFFCNDHCSF